MQNAMFVLCFSYETAYELLESLNLKFKACPLSYLFNLILSEFNQVPPGAHIATVASFSESSPGAAWLSSDKMKYDKIFSVMILCNLIFYNKLYVCLWILWFCFCLIF